jgi:hypothetical protein
MSYNNADNYPLPYAFNDDNTGKKTYTRPLVDHPIKHMKPGETYQVQNKTDYFRCHHIMKHLRDKGWQIGYRSGIVTRTK